MFPDSWFPLRIFAPDGPAHQVVQLRTSGSLDESRSERSSELPVISGQLVTAPLVTLILIMVVFGSAVWMFVLHM